MCCDPSPPLFLGDKDVHLGRVAIRIKCEPYNKIKVQPTLPTGPLLLKPGPPIFPIEAVLLQYKVGRDFCHPPSVRG